MAYEALTQAECQQDEPVTTDLLLKIKNNFDYLYSIIGSGSGGGSGGGGGGFPNGSFEIDEDGDNIPDTWTRYLYPGGSAAYDTDTPMHGAKAYKFTRAAGSNNGGGYLESDYVATSELFNGPVWVIYRCSVPGVKVMVQFRFYDKAKVEIGAPTTVFSSTDNPTTRKKIILWCDPPATARFFKMRLIGGYTDTDVEGDTFFDGTGISDGSNWRNVPITIAEISTPTSTTGNATLPLPALSADGVARITFMAETHGAAGTPDIHFSIGSELSNSRSGVAGGAYGPTGPFSILYAGAGGEVTLTCHISTDSGTIYARMAAEPVCIEVLVP
jgi:hypothetical protein